ncbi:unnamed protein product [Pleuronectes platessa]|uniref:Uncharacterized protein n=1 Tax=Pleuronectes platessa TaxID=8262 RepID=A0A9N7YL27_PLEPL|nr:unnamed protein product [Pleuronectes platessa]
MRQCPFGEPQHSPRHLRNNGIHSRDAANPAKPTGVFRDLARCHREREEPKAQGSTGGVTLMLDCPNAPTGEITCRSEDAHSPEGLKSENEAKISRVSILPSSTSGARVCNRAVERRWQVLCWDSLESLLCSRGDRLRPLSSALKGP